MSVREMPRLGYDARLLASNPQERMRSRNRNERNRHPAGRASKVRIEQMTVTQGELRRKETSEVGLNK
jgi:hypothetical protein